MLAVYPEVHYRDILFYIFPKYYFILPAIYNIRVLNYAFDFIPPVGFSSLIHSQHLLISSHSPYLRPSSRSLHLPPICLVYVDITLSPLIPSSHSLYLPPSSHSLYLPPFCLAYVDISLPPLGPYTSLLSFPIPPSPLSRVRRYHLISSPSLLSVPIPPSLLSVPTPPSLLSFPIPPSLLSRVRRYHLIAVLSVTLISPLEMIRTKLQSERLSYDKLGAALKASIRSDGNITLMKGLVPTLFRDVPFSGKPPTPCLQS